MSTFDAQQNMSTGADSFGLGAGDLDGDGVADIVVANYGSHDISVSLVRPNGQILPAQNYSCPFFPTRVAFADLNEDGDLDVIVGSYTLNAIAIFFGNGDGTLQPRVAIACPSPPHAVAEGDVNGDGHRDLILGTPGGAYLLLGSGTGTFSPPVRCTTDFVTDVAVADFNGDGHLDLAASNIELGSFTVLLGDGSGTFQSAGTFIVGGSPRYITIADLNLDGRKDLAAAMYDQNRVAVLFGAGDGTLSSASFYPVGAAPIGLASADYDGDGVVDLISSNRYGDSVSLLFNQGDGSFGPQREIFIGSGRNPYGVIALDFDGDGLMDAATANNEYSNLFPGSLSLLRHAGPLISRSPDHAIVCPSGTAAFSVTASGTGSLTYHWQWQPETIAAWTDLANGINSYLGQPALDVTGATESTLRPRVLWGLGGNLPFRCIVSNACGSVTSNAATLTICAADFNCDASVDFFDYLDFVDAFTSSATSADFNGDGFIDFFDYLDFVDAFSTGC